MLWSRFRVAVLLFVLLMAFSACAEKPIVAHGSNTTAKTGIASAPDILHVHVVGLRNSKGGVVCSLFSRPAAFPEHKSLREVEVSISNDAAWCSFRGLPAGKYAMVVFHDENNNHKFDRDALGIPLEGYAFSNNVHATLGPPTFSQASFKYHGGEQWLTITMTYLR